MQLDQFTENGNYLMLACDHRENFKKYINPQFPEKVTDEETINAVKEIIKSINDDFSGILLDEKYSLAAYKELYVDKPFALPLEKSNYELIDNEKVTILDKEPSDIESLGAEATKILIYFDPNLKSAEEKSNLVKKVIEQSHKTELPIFLVIISEDTQNYERVIDSVDYFLKRSVIPDVFVLEFPGSDYMCRKVSNSLGAVPWVMISGGADYILFKEQLKIAAENGCRGFVIGRSLWQEYFDIAESERKKHFLEFTLPLRFEEIKEIMKKS
jgi:tagatose 1,6-diphosphate aldolase